MDWDVRVRLETSCFVLPFQAVALNAKKLEQIQNFEKKAFGTVSADNFHATLLNIERTLVPVVHFIQTRINKPVFGYHIFNRYTLGVLFAIGCVPWR